MPCSTYGIHHAILPVKDSGQFLVFRNAIMSQRGGRIGQKVLAVRELKSIMFNEKRVAFVGSFAQLNFRWEQETFSGHVREAINWHRGNEDGRRKKTCALCLLSSPSWHLSSIIIIRKVNCNAKKSDRDCHLRWCNAQVHFLSRIDWLPRRTALDCSSCIGRSRRGQFTFVDLFLCLTE